MEEDAVEQPYSVIFLQYIYLLILFYIYSDPEYTEHERSGDFYEREAAYFRKVIFINAVSECIYIWRRIRHCDIDEEKICG